jgi:hypothetical protein
VGGAAVVAVWPALAPTIILIFRIDLMTANSACLAASAAIDKLPVPTKTIDRIRPVLEKGLKLNVRVPWYSVTRLIVDTLIKRSFTTYTELKATWLKPTSEDFSLNALPQLDSVFADIVNINPIQRPVGARAAAG